MPDFEFFHLPPCRAYTRCLIFTKTWMNGTQTGLQTKIQSPKIIRSD